MSQIGINRSRSYLPDLNNYSKNRSDEEDEEDDREPVEEIQGWNLFKHYPPKLKTGSKADKGFFDLACKIIKIITYGVLFFLVLCAGIIAKGAILFAAAQIDDNGPVKYCDYNDAEQRPGGRNLSATMSAESRNTWYLFIFLAFAVPEVIGLLNALYYCLFKKRVIPELLDVIFLLIVDGLQAIGLSILFLFVIPEVNSVHAIVITSCICFVPGFLGVFSQNRARGARRRSILVVLLDVLAFAGQFCGVFVWLLPDNDIGMTWTAKWLLSVALILISCRWWGNYVSLHSNIGLMRLLSRIRERLQESRGITMACSSIWRILVFLASFILIAHFKGIKPSQLLDASNLSKEVNISLYDLSRASSFGIEIGLPQNAALEDTLVGYRTVKNYYLPLIVFVVQAVAAFIAYSSSRFACRTLMQKFGFAFPASLVTPGSIAILLLLCALRNKNACVFHGFMPDYIFFNPPKDIESLGAFFSHWYPWIWPVTLLSQAWITRQIWTSSSAALAATELIFSVPTYDSLVVDQAIMINRQNDQDHPEDDSATEAEKESITESGTLNRSSESRYIGNEKSDRTTKIIACATMWHETEDEMTEFMGSILRLDTERGLMRFTEGRYNVELDNYFEFETHIFFDDAFCCMHGCKGGCKHDENETQINDYVMDLIKTVQKCVERRNISYTPPTKYPAPYGGRLVYTLPGKTILTVHLKDKNKIRHRKRWSQVMYMYYLLGFRLMDQPISRDRKETIAENTFLLALDGDIDFRPAAVKVLVDLMKKDKDLGAACGRIHPVGTGPMVWFQKFEYAIGHWLQKSTEHTIGSVLCSPGCFSLFRARALMQHNVMRKYAIQATEPLHYVQYDQGEDRWLCTLLLQVGYRVEYSAASDSYTHAPEAFNEFYNQRRRWIPSTIANIFDLLYSSDETRKCNDDISWLYMAYQWVLMGSTILGPGTIFLMLVGAFVSAFRIDNWSSFGYNLIPLAIFVTVCILCKADIQLMVAGIISAFYGLVMIVVLVGIMIQIAEDGWVAPSTILFFVVASQIVIAGLVHPQEWACLLCGLVYYVTVPSMYMLLIIYSLFNVNNVTWGTRDSAPAPEKEEDEDAEKKGQPKNEKTAAKAKSAAKKAKERGSIEFSLAGLFKCMLCTKDTSTDEDQQFKILAESLDRISSRLDAMERNADEIHTPPNYREEKLASKPRDFERVGPTGKSESQCSSPEDYLEDSDEDEESYVEQVSEVESDVYANDSTRVSNNFLVSPDWLHDERLRKGGVDYLKQEEEKFWEGLIEKYLHPLDEDKAKLAKIAQGLLDLRNEYLFKFFMVNALFVLIVFLMQLNKDVLHFEWPLGATYNVTFDPIGMEVHLQKDYLKLEPIGCLFIVGFVVILSVQFIAMLFHRWETFAHVLARTNVGWRSWGWWNKCFSCCNKPDDEMFDENLGKHAGNFADGLRRVLEENTQPTLARATSVAPGKRKTVHELEDSRNNRTKMPANIDSLLRKNLNDPHSEMSRLMSASMPQRVFEAFERRHSTIVGQKKQSQINQSEIDNIYNKPDDIPIRSQQHLSLPKENGQAYDNGGFSGDESNEEFPKSSVTIPHRPSRVNFHKPNNA